MKLVVNGVEYDGRLQPFIGDLRLLKRTLGFGWGTVAERMQRISPETDALALLDDEEFLDALLAWMWMVRLRAGERDVTFDQVLLTPIDDIRLLGDDPSAAEEAARDEDPTQASAPTDSEPADAPREARARASATRTSTSKTSKLRSISA